MGEKGPIVAERFRDARPGQLVYVSSKGRSLSRQRRRAQSLLVALAAGAVVTLGAVLTGPLVIFSVGGAVLLTTPTFIRARRLNRAVALLAGDQLDQAEALLKRCVSGFLSPRWLRALAWQNRAAIDVQRGDFETAAERRQQALALYQKMWRKPVHYYVASVAQIATLIELERQDQAEAALAALEKEMPDGDYLRVQWWSAELYVAFGRGSHDFDDDALHERVRVALDLSGSAGLLALLAWAHGKSGDHDQASHLMSEARDRGFDTRLKKHMPRLAAWIEQA